LGVFSSLLLSLPLQAKPSAPLPYTSFDGGVFSAESLGRGGTVASNRGTPASGSENPASLISLRDSYFYSTIYAGTTSDLEKEITRESSPLSDKVLQYLAIGAEKGVLYYEPLGRLDEQQSFDLTSQTTYYRDVKFSADAIGLAGATEFKKTGSVGLSLAYLHAALAHSIHQDGAITETKSDTGHGVRLNLGMRYPVGPVMVGLMLQNAPGFLWWKNLKSETLPVRFRIANTIRLAAGHLFSMEAEKRYYNEGGDSEEYLYFGQESGFGKHLILRVGLFSNDINKSEAHHWTGGLTIITGANAEVTYAFEHFKMDDETVVKSYLSFNLPFGSEPRAND
jgi:hypothetical protein